MSGPRHQVFDEMTLSDAHPTLRASFLEIRAILATAVSTAKREQMFGTAERLQQDLDLFVSLAHEHDQVRIEIDTSRER